MKDLISKDFSRFVWSLSITGFSILSFSAKTIKFSLIIGYRVGQEPMNPLQEFSVFTRQQIDDICDSF
jgi:hypothetical protein